jgi:hypothetical protein
MDYRKIFSDLILEIDHNDKIYDFERNLPEGLSSSEIIELEKKAGLKLDKQVKTFYRALNGVKIEWRVKMALLKNNSESYNNVDMVGSINILSLAVMLFGENKESPWKDNLWFDFQDKEAVKQLSILRPFDLFNNDDKELTAFEVKGKRLSENLFYYSLSNGVSDFKMTIEEYVQELIKTKGFMFWHRAKLMKNSRYTKELKYFLPQIFSNKK